MNNEGRFVVVVDSKAVERMLTIAPVKARKHLNSILDMSAIEVRKNVTKEAPVAVTGLLKQTITKEGNLSREIGSRANYAKYVEYGTRPHWTSKENLQDWADLRGIDVGALQYSIAMKGTKPNDFFARAYEASKPKVDRIASAGLKTMVKDIART